MAAEPNPPTDPPDQFDQKPADYSATFNRGHDVNERGHYEEAFEVIIDVPGVGQLGDCLMEMARRGNERIGRLLDEAINLNERSGNTPEVERLSAVREYMSARREEAAGMVGNSESDSPYRVPDKLLAYDETITDQLLKRELGYDGLIGFKNLLVEMKRMGAGTVLEAAARKAELALGHQVVGDSVGSVEHALRIHHAPTLGRCLFELHRQGNASVVELAELEAEMPLVEGDPLVELEILREGIAHYQKLLSEGEGFSDSDPDPPEPPISPGDSGSSRAELGPRPPSGEAGAAADPEHVPELPIQVIAH